MRKNFIFSLILAVCVVVLSFACVKPEVSAEKTSKNVNNNVVTVAKSEKENKVLETRFLNMLNSNFVYNNDFYDDTALVNNSVLALLDLVEDSYVEETYLKDYIFNMYGKIYDDFAFLGETEKSGYVYVIPRGYSIYTHKIENVTDNGDGSYTVTTLVEISYEDGSLETFSCETVFLANEESAFGYNIMYSDILETVSNGIDC
ncbi:MAG: hypothetical protein E7537_03175 [Ruminococcaceae bacterium]|nr:hypothetical protein [Oscillospiraceae bacterium]